uniref:Putative secreted protein n=1 Tax=Ixodes ricinus TaxID=34613 RepID=A0A6B0UHM1_IXORI
MKLYIVEIHSWADMVLMLQDNLVLAFVLIIWHNCSCLLCNTVFTNYVLHSGDFVGFLLLCLYLTLFLQLWQWSVLFSSFFFFSFTQKLLLCIILFLWLYVCTNVS